MAYLLDTSIVIALREREPLVLDLIETLEGPVAISVFTQIELIGGVYRFPEDQAIRQAELDTLLGALSVLALSQADIVAYGNIIQTAGYSRRKLLDRMIAAQALVHGLTLVTANPGDFADVPGLSLLGW